jgi:hypothetical protein
MVTGTNCRLRVTGSHAQQRKNRREAAEARGTRKKGRRSRSVHFSFAISYQVDTGFGLATRRFTNRSGTLMFRF